MHRLDDADKTLMRAGRNNNNGIDGSKNRKIVKTITKGFSLIVVIMAAFLFFIFGKYIPF
jgi:hypothetical protein